MLTYASYMNNDRKNGWHFASKLRGHVCECGDSGMTWESSCECAASRRPCRVGLPAMVDVGKSSAQKAFRVVHTCLQLVVGTSSGCAHHLPPRVQNRWLAAVWVVLDVLAFSRRCCRMLTCTTTDMDRRAVVGTATLYVRLLKPDVSTYVEQGAMAVALGCWRPRDPRTLAA